MNVKEKLLESFNYAPLDIIPQLHPQSLERLVLATITCVTADQKNVELFPGNVLQPWVLEQLKTVISANYDNAH